MKCIFGIVAAIAMSSFNISLQKETKQKTIEPLMQETRELKDLGDANEYKIEKPSSLIGKEGKIIDKYHTYSDKDGNKDDFKGGSNDIASNNVLITAKISRRNWWERIFAGYSEIDTDWYRFSIRESYTYSFTFRAPNDSYICSLRKYRGMENVTRMDVHSVSDEEISYLRGRDAMSITLNPGTYYLKVTVDNASDIESTEYNILFEQTDAKTRNNLINFDNDTKSNNCMALWENDLLPDNVERWKSADQALGYHSVLNDGLLQGANLPVEDGYCDPVYQNEGKYLESVLFVWGHDYLVRLNEVLSGVHQHVYDECEKYNLSLQDVEKIEVTLEPWHGFGVRVFLDLAGYIPYLGDALTGYDIGDAFNEAIAYSANFICENELDTVRKYNLGFGGFLQGVRDACDFITSENYSGLDVVCIPRYARIMEKHVEEFGQIDKDYYMWCPSYDGLDLNYSPYIFKYPYLYTMQTARIAGVDKAYHGKISLFETGEDFINYTGLNYRELIAEYDPHFGDYNVIETNQVLFDKELAFNHDNDHRIVTGLFYEQNETVNFLTRGEIDTIINLYDDQFHLLATNDNGGFSLNAFLTYSVQAFKFYRVEVIMKTNNPNSQGWCCLTAISAMTYDNDYNFIQPNTFNDIGQIVGCPFEGFLEVAMGKATMINFVPEYTGAYYFSAFNLGEFTFAAIPLDGTAEWNYYSSTGSGRQDEDFVYLNEEVPCLIVLARSNKYSQIPNNQRGYGLLIDIRNVGSDT